MIDNEKKLPRIWLAALACFIIAGATGSLLRFGLLHGLPAGLGLVNVRHAHSHLMYFGWVTPVLMLFIIIWISRISGRTISSRFRWVMGVTIAVALLAYVMFIQFGYQAADFNGQRLPLSVFAATLNVLAWYVYAYLYYKITRGLMRNRAIRFWDAAIIFMILASFGAWGVAVVSRLQIADPFWSQAMTHLFLDLFSEGWFVLAVLGLIYAVHSPKSDRIANWGEQLIVVGLPVLFLLALPVNLVPGGLRAIASVGGLLVGAGLLLTIWTLWPAVTENFSGWRIPLALLSLKAIVGLGMILPVTARWAQQNGLRILYLHLLLLGFVTLGLVVAAWQLWGKRAVPGQRWLVATVLLLLLSLVPLTGLWPDAWVGRWMLQVAAWVSLGPVIVVAWMLIRLISRERQGEPVLVSSPAQAKE